MHEIVVRRRLVMSIALLLMMAVVLQVVFGRGQEQAFAAFGAAKRVALPLTYLVFAAATVYPHGRVRRSARPPVPAWLWLLAVCVWVSLAARIFRPGSASDVLQGVGLMGGFCLLGWFGTGATEWDEAGKRQLTWLLLSGAVISGMFRIHGLTPFLALTVPGFFASLALTIFGAGARRSALGALTLVLGYLMIRSIQPDASEPASSAVVGEIVVCAVLLLLALLPAGLRKPVVLVGGGVALVAFVRLDGWALLAGRLQSTDVTIAQRSFEASQVLHGLSKSLVTTLIGYGPGATVDLSRSPDAATLAASGRQLDAVDDVHLLTAYMLLKLGVAGLAWLAVLIAAIARVTWGALASGPDRAWRLTLSLFVLAGVVNALPAATNLLVNPLVPLLLGLLWADDRSRGVNRPAPESTRDSPAEPTRVTGPGHARIE